MRKWLSLMAVLAATLLPTASQAHDEGGGVLPMKVAVLPFRCIRACPQLPALQGALEATVMEDSVFDLLMTRETEDIFLGLPRFRSAFDSLTARASRGIALDSSTAQLLCRRLHVDGFLYGYMTDRGPAVEVWAAVPRPGVVFRYTGTEERRMVLPDARHEGADSKRAQPTTGGATVTNTASGSTSHVEGTAEIPQSGNNQQQAVIAGNGSVDDRTREMSEVISRRLLELRRSGGQNPGTH